MKNDFEKVLVCVEDVNLDGHVIEYTHMIAKAVGMKSVHLLHVIPNIAGDAQVMRKSEMKGNRTLDLDLRYQEEINRLRTAYLKAMKDTAVKHFDDLSEVEHHVEVVVGNQLHDTLATAHEKDIDLIVVGRHLGARLSKADVAVLPTRITRKATCSVLTVPESFSPRLSNILCPVRYSDCSANSLQTAIDLANAFKAVIHAVNVFHVYDDNAIPGVPAPPQISREDKIAAAQERMIEENESLAKQVEIGDADIHFSGREDKKFQPANVYEEIVADRGCDLVVIGARGRTGAAGVLLGSITEQLIKQCNVPLLASKKKGDHVGLFEAMMVLFGKR